MNNLVVVIVLYLICSVSFNQCYKLLVNKMINAGALTVIINIIAGIFTLFLIPFFEVKIPTNFFVYIFLCIACIFYALNDRLATTARIGIEASTFCVIKQVSTIFMLFIGLFFFKESFVLKKLIGAFLIIFGNILVFYKKGRIKNNKYVWLGIIANLFLTIALVIDINYSKQFNLALYVSFILLIPGILILIFERIKINDIIKEYKNVNKRLMLATTITWSLMLLFKLKAFLLGEIIVIAPLCSLTVILNVIVGYLFLKEKDELIKKIVAAILVVLSIVLIKG